MSWMNMLYRTYEANSEVAGKVGEKAPLSIVAHMPATAQIEITIDAGGSFIGARETDKESSRTIIPVTEKSASRSSGIAPHALCDELSYIAGDFAEYTSDEKTAKKAEDKFKAYSDALQSWSDSDYSHVKVKAIRAYIAKSCVISDLVKAGICTLDENGKLSDKKIDGRAYEKSIVRFRVQGTDPDAVWQDKSLFDCYTGFYLSTKPGKKDLCYLTGENELLADSHPKGIVLANNSAKLISANDKSNFVFRGRFATSEQASAVSYEATQKAHSALSWLAARQGVNVGNRTFICWNPKGKEVAKLDNPLGLEDDGEPQAYTEERYRKRLLETLRGYRNRLDDNDDIVVIGLDAATTGRLSVTYYNELKNSDFYDRLQHWGETCNWYFTKFTPDKKPYNTVLTPFTANIVKYAFGTERGEYIEADDRVKKEQTQRILSCMLDKKQLPYDIVHALTVRASNPQAYTRGNHERILSVACAIIAKYYRDKGVEIKMTLDKENCGRSYLFGRLLAVLEKAERSAFSDGESREPNAIRLQCAYVNRPMSTWRSLEEKLNPYFRKLQPGSRKFYKDLIAEILSTISEGDAEKLNLPLGEEYLIGYYLQRMELNKYNNNEKND